MSKYHARKRLTKVITVATFALIICGVFITYSLTSHPAAVSVLNKSMLGQPTVSTPTAGTEQVSVSTPTASTKQTVVSTPATQPTQSNNQQGQTGVFPLSSGGPLPISEGILHPTNIARVMLNGVLTSVYAGSLTQNPQAGVLVVLQENLASGQIDMHLYQSSPSAGPLTILAVHNTTLSIADPQAQGTFNLSTDQFHW